MENILIGKGDGILFKPLALIITFLFFWQSAYALEKSDIEDIGTLIKKHQIEKLSNKEEKYHAYSVLGRELELYGFAKEAIDIMPAAADLLEVYTDLLSAMYRDNPENAASFVHSYYKAKVVNSQSKLKKDVIRQLKASPFP